jgi:hypothetical protein
MKKAILLAFVFLGSTSHAIINEQGDVVQDILSLECKGETGSLAFDLNYSTKTVTFTNIQAFRRANILKDTAFGVHIKRTANSTLVNFDYTWHSTASYELSLQKQDNKWDLTLNGDDDDGTVFNNKSFSCLKLK